MQLGYREIRVLAKVVETHSAGAAGDALGLSQSSISQTIKAVEAAIGVALFRREGRRLTPTPDALRLAAEARNAIGAMARLNALAEAIARGGDERVAIGVMAAFIHGAVARAIADFAVERPSTACTVASLTKAEIAAALARSELDLGVVIGAVEEPWVVTIAEVHSQVVCVLPPGHRLADHAVLRNADLERERLVRLTAGSPLRVMLEAAGYDSGGARGGVVEAATQRAMVAMVEAGVGIALMDPLVLSETDRVVVRPFRPVLPIGVRLVGRSDWRGRTAARDLADRVAMALEAIPPLPAGHHPD